MKHLYINNDYKGSFSVSYIKDIAKRENLRVTVCKSNGYSHDWEEVEELAEDHFNDASIYLTSKTLGRVFGSSTVSFT